MWAVAAFIVALTGSAVAGPEPGITLQANDGTPLMTWNLTRCLPTRFKVADLGAAKGEVGVEELHLVHEGFAEVTP